jgi:hypothetical protein
VLVARENEAKVGASLSMPAGLGPGPRPHLLVSLFGGETAHSKLATVCELGPRGRVPDQVRPTPKALLPSSPQTGSPPVAPTRRLSPGYNPGSSIEFSLTYAITPRVITLNRRIEDYNIILGVKRQPLENKNDTSGEVSG